jgi:hypothetical protein
MACRILHPQHQRVAAPSFLQVFASNYTRLRGLEMPPASESVLSQ